MQADALVDQVLAARRAGDDATTLRLLAQVPDDQLASVLARLEAVAGEGTHVPQPADLRSALERAGFPPDEAERLATLATADPGTALSALAGTTPADELATRLVEHCPALDVGHTPRVSRYLRRLFAGQHDLRRLTATARASLAAALDVPAELIEALREREPRVDGQVGLLAARGSVDAPRGSAGDGHDDPVDRLFNCPE